MAPLFSSSPVARAAANPVFSSSPVARAAAIPVSSSPHVARAAADPVFSSSAVARAARMKLLVVGDSLFEKLENIFKRKYGVPNWTFEVHAGKEPLRLGCAKQRRLDYDAVVYVSAGNAMYDTDLKGMWKNIDRMMQPEDTCVVLVGSAELWSEMAKVRPDSVHMDFFENVHKRLMCKGIAHCQVVDEMRSHSYQDKLGHPTPASREDLVPILMDAFAAVVPPTRLGCSPRGSGEQGPTESLTPQPPAPLPPPVQQKDGEHSVDGAVRQRKCGEQGPTQPLPAGCPPPPVNEPAAAAGQQQHWHRREGCSLVEQGPAKTPKLEPSSTSL